MYTGILIPLDSSATAEQVIPYARTFARCLKLPVELLAVIDTGALLTSVDRARHLEELSAQEIDKAKAYLESIARRFLGSRVKRTVEQGGAADVIIQKAAEDNETLIVMTTHGRSGMHRWLLGSVAEKVLRGASNPLCLVRATAAADIEGEASLKTIIVPLDGSKLAEAALPVATNTAAKLGAEIFLLRVYSNPYIPFAGGAGAYAVNVDELLTSVREEGRSYLEEKMAEVRRQGGEEVSYLLEEGIAPDTIVSVATHTPESLVVMCSHGRSGVKRWALGSVAETVARHSKSPVLVLRAG